MKFLFGLMTLLNLQTVMATDLVVVNKTNAQVRIDSLAHYCGDGIYITSENPVWLAPEQTWEKKNITPVMHHYKICGLGFCSSTAMGIKDDIEYVLEIQLDDFLINGVPKPDHWIGNTECPVKPK